MTGYRRNSRWAAAAASYRGTLQVGLVNNMPDTAMRATELQFARLLKEAAGALDVRLRLFSLAEIDRGELARSRMEGFYADAETLPTAGIDALIVTGAEPRAEDLREENYWHALAHLVDWAEIGTISTLFSCLAAHAAVLHLDGIERRKLPAKIVRRLRRRACRRGAAAHGLRCQIPGAAFAPQRPCRKRSGSARLSHPVAPAERRRGLFRPRHAGPQPVSFPAGPSRIWRRDIWAANICATSAASCAAKAANVPSFRKIISTAPRKMPWPRWTRTAPETWPDYNAHCLGRLAAAVLARPYRQAVRQLAGPDRRRKDAPPARRAGFRTQARRA